MTLRLRPLLLLAFLALPRIAMAAAPGSELDLVFNTTTPTNDLRGDLSAQVLFAQSQVIPARPRPDDRQPRLVSLRRTLLMVRPQRSGSPSPLAVTVVSGAGRTLGTLTLDPPGLLPKTAYFTEGVPAGGVDFTVKDTEPDEVTAAADIARLSEADGVALRERLARHDLIEVRTGDGRWTRHIRLPAGKGLDGKAVRIVADAGYGSTIHYDGRQVNVGRGQTVLLKCAGGRWFRDGELDNNRLRYAADAWSAVLPGEWILPGVSFRFRQGSLAGELTGVAVGAPTQLLLHTIDIGMLTAPRAAFAFAKDPEAHREYFQTLPATRLVVSQYAPLHLTEVMLPTGELLKELDPGKGGWHEGTMRQRIGKELVSHGIDNANYGLHSTAGVGERSHPYVVAQLAAHNNRGVYANGVQVHGGSGGGGIVTLDDSLGNEFSHEVGHNYGLGHYVDGFKGSVHRSADQVNSTWGWDADRNRFLPNFAAVRSGKASALEGQSQEPFDGRSFGFDAMAGGAPFSSFNRFTLYTPNTAAIIQNFLEGKAVFDGRSPTGFSRWNADAAKMEPYAHRLATAAPVSAPIKGLDEASLAALFAEHAWVRVAMGDGNWAKAFTVPAASPANKGRILSLEHGAAYATDMIINGAAERITRGTSRSFVSDGKRWNEGKGDEGSLVRKPLVFGAAVVTLVGYYDPEQKLRSYVYPPLHGALGFCYADDSAALRPTDCQLVVESRAVTFRFRLDGKRIDLACMNKFHVNVPAAAQPRSVSLVIGGKVVDRRSITPTTERLAVTVNGLWPAAK
ncbi:MAG: M66 family metalloprotease [Opitutales bacterium]